jgi:hypothetical protein
MKFHYSVFISVFLFVQSLHAQIPSSVISFEERTHEFGTVLEKNGKVTHAFVFTNNGKTPVVINDIRSDCGCIGKIISRDPVKPGQKGRVVITFDPEYKSGFFSKEIIVYSNNGQNYNRIWVQGNVTPSEHPVEEDYPYNFGNGIYLRLKVMAFGYMKPGETQQMQLHYANNTNKSINLTFTPKGKNPGIKFTNPGKLKPKERSVLTFTFTMPDTKDDVLFTLSPTVNGKQSKESLDIKVLNGNKRKVSIAN